MQLTITATTPTRIQVRLSDGDTTLELFDGKATAGAIHHKIADIAGVTTKQIVKWIGEFPDYDRKNPHSATYDVPGIGVAVDKEFTVIVRDQLNTKSIKFTDTPLNALSKALQYDTFDGVSPIIEWSDYDQLCVLDIDYHNWSIDRLHSRKQLEQWMSQIQPRPSYYHVSHGNGCKLYYISDNGITARELASVAALAWHNLDGRCTLEICKSSRHPKYMRGVESAGDVIPVAGSSDISSIGKWFSRQADQSVIDEYLISHNMSINQRLPHTQCVIDPSDKDGTPVAVYDSGIHCFICAAKGKALGNGRTPGFTPWSSIVGGTNPVLYLLAKNFTHWEHAGIILKTKFKLSDNILRNAYSAAVKLLHGYDDPRIGKIFLHGIDFVRWPGRWVTLDGTTTYSKDSINILANLPCNIMQSKEKYVPDREKIDYFKSGGDLTRYGYPDLRPTRGIAIYGHHLPYRDDRYAYTIAHKNYRERYAKYAPKYVERTQRISNPWSYIESIFPGIDQRYVTILLAMKGIVEGRAAQAPFMVVSGPSGSAKSTTCHIAAGMCGDYASDVTWDRDDTRFRQNITSGVDKGDFIVVNELFKNAEKERVDYKKALDVILNITEDSSSHKLYVGPVTMSRLAVMAFTDTRRPNKIASDIQLARRFIYVPLTKRLEWKPTFLEHGLTTGQEFRKISLDISMACDSIVSEVIDEFFSESLTLDQMAERIGYTTLEKSNLEESPIEVMRRLFELVCKHKPIEFPLAAKYHSSKGWKEINPSDIGELRELWDDIADGKSGDPWYESRRCEEIDWSKVLGVSESVNFEIRAVKGGRGSLVLRFTQGSKYNEQIGESNTPT